MSIASERSDTMRHIKQPTFAELFAPKLITVAARRLWLCGFSRRRDLRPDGGDRCAAPVDGDCHRVGRDPRSRTYTAVIGASSFRCSAAAGFRSADPPARSFVLVALTAERHGVDGRDSSPPAWPACF